MIPIKQMNTERKIAVLTEQEKITLQHLCSGLMNAEIAHKMGISIETVKQYNKSIFKKLTVRNRSEAVSYFFESSKN